MTFEEFHLLVQPDVKRFINLHLNENPELFALKNSKKNDMPYRAISEQLLCRKKANIKLPNLSKQDLLYEKTALEQCSSELTADYKSELINGNRIIDLTGGLGIDSIYFSRKMKEVVYCEENQLLTDIFLHNSKELNISNINIKYGNGLNILQSFPDNYFDWIYIDPSRRQNDRRTVGLQNCFPNILEYIKLFHNKSKNIMIKASPAIEIEEVRKQLKSIKNIFTVSVDDECKEVLIILSNNSFNNFNVSSVMINSENLERQIISDNIENKYERKISDKILKYFYEPDSAIIKARLTAKISDLHYLLYLNNTVDYLTSDNYVPDFPGRVFEVKDFTVYSKNNFKNFLLKNNIKYANIARRDFPDSPESIKNKYSIKDGGNNFLFFTKNHLGKLITILCNKPHQLN